MSLILISILAAVVLAFAATGCSRPQKQDCSVAPQAQASPAANGELLKMELRQKLRELEQSSDPADVRPGAMCYRPAALPKSYPYTCPECMEKTVYVMAEGTHASLSAHLHRNLDNCRRLIKEVQALPVVLDENSLCKVCTPDAERRELNLIVQYPGKPPHVVHGINADDLTLLVEFSQGQTAHKTTNDGRFPLKNQIPRLEELLGVSIHD